MPSFRLRKRNAQRKLRILSFLTETVVLNLVYSLRNLIVTMGLNPEIQEKPNFFIPPPISKSPKTTNPNLFITGFEFCSAAI